MWWRRARTRQRQAPPPPTAAAVVAAAEATAAAVAKAVQAAENLVNELDGPGVAALGNGAGFKVRGAGGCIVGKGGLGACHRGRGERSSRPAALLPFRQGRLAGRPLASAAHVAPACMPPPPPSTHGRCLFPLQGAGASSAQSVSDARYSAEQLDFMRRKLDSIQSMPAVRNGSAPRSASPRVRACPAFAGGVQPAVLAARLPAQSLFGVEQRALARPCAINLLRWRRSPLPALMQPASPSSRPASPQPAAPAANGSFTPEQLAFLQRKRSASQVRAAGGRLGKGSWMH